MCPSINSWSLLFRKPPDTTLKKQLAYSKENKFVLPHSSVDFSIYTGNTNWSVVFSGKSPYWANGHADGRSQMCMTETWLGCCGWWGSWLHRMCLWNKGGHCLSHLWEPERGEAIFTWILCWGMQCRAVGRSHCKQLQVPLTPPSSTPPRERNQSSRTGLGRADIIAFATLSGSWESDATGARC